MEAPGVGVHSLEFSQGAALLEALVAKGVQQTLRQFSRPHHPG